MTLSINSFFATPSIINDITKNGTQHKNTLNIECHYAERRDLCIVMLNVIMLNAIMLNTIMLNAIMLIVVIYVLLC
jgi:hypothetical protein